MSRLAILLASVSALVLVIQHAPAGAQEANPLVRERIGVNNADTRGQQVRVQSNVNFFLAGPTGEGDAANQLRDRARRMIYEMAARECTLVEDALARTCRLEAISVNINRNQGSGMGDGYSANGNVSMTITLK